MDVKVKWKLRAARAPAHGEEESRKQASPPGHCWVNSHQEEHLQAPSLPLEFPTGHSPPTKNNRKWIAKAPSDDYYYESLWENVIGTQPWNWIPLPHFIGTYWAWQFDERIADYLDALPSLIGSTLIKSIYWVLVTTSVTVRRKEKN